MSAERIDRRSWALAVAIAIAALAWDPAAPAADPKRLLLLLVAAGALASARRRDVAVEVAPAAPLFVAFVALSALSLARADANGWRELATLGGATLLLVGAMLRPRAEAAALTCSPCCFYSHLPRSPRCCSPNHARPGWRSRSPRWRRWRIGAVRSRERPRSGSPRRSAWRSPSWSRTAARGIRWRDGSGSG